MAFIVIPSEAKESYTNNSNIRLLPSVAGQARQDGFAGLVVISFLVAGSHPLLGQ